MAFIKTLKNLFLKIPRSSFYQRGMQSTGGTFYRFKIGRNTVYRNFWIRHWKVPVLGGLAAATLSEEIDVSEEDLSPAPKEKSFEEDQVILIIKHAKVEEMSGEYDRAGKYYHRVLRMLSKYEQDNEWEEEKILQARTYVYDCMANMAYSQGHLEEAETLFTETMKGLLQQGIEKDHNSILELSLKLSLIYVSRQQYEKAELGYQYVIDSQEKKFKRNPDDIDDNSLALLGMCCNSYSRFLMLKGRLTEAREQIEKAIELANKSLDENNIQISILLNDAATIATRQGDFDYALEKLDKAINLSEASDSDDEVPAFYCNLGEVYLRMGDIIKAKETCQKALTLAKTVKNIEAAKQARACLADIKKKTMK